MASLSMPKPIIKRLLSHIKRTSKDDKVNKVIKTILNDLTITDLVELEKSVVCQGKEPTLCVVLRQSSDNQR